MIGFVLSIGNADSLIDTLKATSLNGPTGRTAGEPDAIDNEVDLHPGWDAPVHECERGAADKETRKRYEAEDQQRFSAHLRSRSDSHRGRGSDSPCAGRGQHFFDVI
jgi:hypothetical protein